LPIPCRIVDIGGRIVVMPARLLALGAIGAALAAGCANKPEQTGPPTPERVQSCLAERDDVRSVETIDAGQPDVFSLTPVQERTLSAALKPSRAAIGADRGGPFEDADGISEAPVGATELHFFPTEADARAAAEAVEPVVGSPADSVFNGVRVLGPVLVLHYSYGRGDSPGGVSIEDDIAPVEACLNEAGYLSS
jgi:hypothetical protein